MRTATEPSEVPGNARADCNCECHSYSHGHGRVEDEYSDAFAVIDCLTRDCTCNADCVAACDCHTPFEFA